jgi:hypothetical protein
MPANAQPSRARAAPTRRPAVAESGLPPPETAPGDGRATRNASTARQKGHIASQLADERRRHCTRDPACRLRKTGPGTAQQFLARGILQCEPQPRPEHARPEHARRASPRPAAAAPTRENPPCRLESRRCRSKRMLLDRGDVAATRSHEARDDPTSTARPRVKERRGKQRPPALNATRPGNGQGDIGDKKRSPASTRHAGQAKATSGRRSHSDVMARERPRQKPSMPAQEGIRAGQLNGGRARTTTTAARRKGQEKSPRVSGRG